MSVDVELSDSDVEALDVILVTIPADARYLRIARLTAAALASDLGFDLDAIEDLRIAVDESCAAVIGASRAGRTLELRYLPAIDGRSVTVEGTCVEVDGATPDEVVVLHPVAAELLDLTTTSHTFWTHEKGRSFRFEKVVEGDGDLS